MSANVYAWPPFQLTGWAIDDDYQQSKSVGLIEGRSRTSAAQRPRRMATAIVSGIGTEMDGAGYVRMLNRMWGSKERLVRVECMSAIWFLAQNLVDSRNNILKWTEGGTELLWTEGGTSLIWGDGKYNLYGEPVEDGGWNSLSVSGFPPSRIVARPSETVSMMDGASTQTAYVMKTARSDATGVAIIRTDREAAFTSSGLVSIGHAENIVFEAQGVPRSVQGLSGNFMFEWNFREVFADEYAGGFVELDPWA